MKMVNLDIVLKDDNTNLQGGISFPGETLKHFLEVAGMPLNSTKEAINNALKECGIQQI